MIDYDPIMRNECTLDNPVFDNTISTETFFGGATGGTYEPTDRSYYRDNTIFTLETHTLDLAVNNFYRNLEKEGAQLHHAIVYHEFELVNVKLHVKGSTTVIVNKTDGKPLALSTIGGGEMW